MKSHEDKILSSTSGLRYRAEQQLRVKAPEVVSLRTEAETQRLLQELQIHEIELEMQNAELCQARDEAETLLEKYTDLYDFAPVGYFTLNHDGVISGVNFSGAALLGVERSRLFGRSFGQYVANEDLTEFSAFLAKIFTSKSKVACELSLQKTGKQPLFVQIEAVADISGQQCRVAIIDISMRRQLEEKLEILHTDLAARSAELESANIELEAFNYSVSHDLRSPLTAINSYCQVLNELCGDSQDDQCKRYILEIYEGSLRMNRLIETLLEFSSVTRVETRNEKVDLSSVVEEIVIGLKSGASERRVRFRITPGINVYADADLLRIVLNNLMGNAWKYTVDLEETVIEFGKTEIDGKQAFFVRDNGPGFDMEHAEKLFSPFHRVHGTGVGGHGIGLATVKRIIQRHGGRVWAESKPGEGATFFFTME